MSLALIALGPALAGPLVPAPQYSSPEPLVDSFANLNALATGDFNGDGNADLLVLNQLGTRLRVVPGFAPADPERAAFGSPITVETFTKSNPFTDELTAVAPADVDADGDLDAVGLLGGRLVLFENVAGQLTSSQPASPPGLPTFTTGLHLDDLDGDGDVDALAVVPSTGGPFGNAYVLSGDGTGSFSAPAAVFASDLSIAAAALGDADGDGDLDVYYLRARPGSQSELRLALNAGAWPTASDTSIEMSSGRPFGVVALGDATGNGQLDVLWSTETGDRFTPGLGSLAFGPTQSLSGPVSFSSLELVDLDLDGDLDALQAQDSPNGPIFWRRNTAGSLGGLLAFPSDVRGQQATRTVDLNGDSFPDVVYAAGDLVRTSLNRGTGVQPLTLPAADVRPQAPAPELVGHADVDRDGDPDLVVIERDSDRVLLGRNRGPGGGVDFETVAGSDRRIESVASGDTNGDGTIDFAVLVGDAIRVHLALGDGTYGAAVVSSIAPLNFSDRLVGAPIDLSGDGHSDAVVRGLGAGNAQVIALFLGDGTGAFAAGTVVATIAPGGPEPQLVDVDGDGALDIVAVPSASNAIHVHLGDGAGGFGAPLVLATQSPVGDFRVADLDGDGDLDAVVREFPGGPAVWRAYAFGGTGFGPAQTIAAFPSDFARLGIRDLDGDGDVDIWGTRGESIQVAERIGPLLSDFGAPTAAVTELVDGPFVNFTPRALDFDRDGDVDFLWSSFNDDQVRIARDLRFGDVGTSFCAQAAPNSSGAFGTLTLGGSDTVAAGALTLRATGLPPHLLALFLCSPAQGVPVTPPGSGGELCLGLGIGRFNQPGNIRIAGPTGEAYLTVDLTALPTPSTFTAAAVGETWSFQVWHRDFVGGAPAANFTLAAAVLLR